MLSDRLLAAGQSSALKAEQREVGERARIGRGVKTVSASAVPESALSFDRDSHANEPRAASAASVEQRGYHHEGPIVIDRR